MAEPETKRDRTGAGAYNAADTGTTGEARPTVGVYDRPEGAGKRGGMNTMTLLIGVILLIVLGAIVWNLFT
jgi:hypothetical protein